MIKATLSQGDKKIVLLGLSFDNIERMRADPLNDFIKINGAELGMSHDIWITAARTDAELGELLLGSVDANTKIHIDPKLKS